MSRLRLAIATGPVIAGTHAQIGIIAECRQAMAVKAIEVVVRGFSRITSDRRSSSLSFPWFAREFWRAAVRIDVGGRLEAGRHQQTVTIWVPQDAPSSYSGEAFELGYRIEVRARVVGWFDARARAALTVIGHPLRPLDDRVAFATRKDGPDARRPYFEASITPRVIEPGASIDGLLSLANVDERCRRLRARLIAVEGIHESFQGQFERNREVARWTIAPGDSVFAPDTPVRFGFQMPRAVVPGFVLARRVSLRWLLEIKADIARASDPCVWIPVDFGRVDAEGGDRRAPTPVGGERIALLWRRFAEERGMSFDGQRLSGAVAGWSLEVWPSDSARKGVRLELELRGPSLGIGLEFGRTWSARDREHARALAAVASPPIGVPYAVDDVSIRWFVERPGLNHERLGWAVRDVWQTAQALRGVIDGLDVPQVLQHWAAAMERLAARYDGELSRASCTVLGKRDALALRVAPIWDDDEVAFCVELELATPMSRETQARWNAADAALLGELATRIGSITAEGGRIRCVMVRAWTPAQAVDDIDQLMLLASASGPGPYR